MVGAGTGSPTYTGRLATAAYRVLGGRGVIPVEGDFGPGTADSHWDEDRFDNELMTGFINLGENPLSVITAASARDLGYGALPFGDRERHRDVLARVGTIQVEVHVHEVQVADHRSVRQCRKACGGLLTAANDRRLGAPAELPDDAPGNAARLAEVRTQRDANGVEQQVLAVANHLW